MASSFLRFLDHTQRRTTVGRTPLDEWSARRRDLYLTTHNTHNRQTSMPPVGFEPTISAGERPQTYALDCAATGTGIFNYIEKQICSGNSLDIQKRKSTWIWCLVLNVFRPRRLLNSPFGAYHIFLIGLTGTSVISSFNTSCQKSCFIQQFWKKCVCENFCSPDVCGIRTYCWVDKTLTWTKKKLHVNDCLLRTAESCSNIFRHAPTH